MNKKLILIMVVGVCSMLHGAARPLRRVNQYPRPGILGENPDALDRFRVKQKSPMRMLESEPSEQPFMCRLPEDRVVEAEMEALAAREQTLAAYEQMRKAQDTEQKALEHAALMEHELQHVLDVLEQVSAENSVLRKQAAQFEEEQARWKAHIQQMHAENIELQKQVLQEKIEKAQESLERIKGELQQARRENKQSAARTLEWNKQSNEKLIKNLQDRLSNCLKVHDIM